MSLAPPLLLFGAFDRHNFGDLLFPHIAAALLPGRRLHHAGLAERDLRAFGGHRVAALARLARNWREPSRPGPALLHVGGETLTCTAWQAAVMLQPPEALQATLAYFEQRPELRQAWVQAQLGSSAALPYVADAQRYPGLGAVLHAGVGGVGLDQLEAPDRAALLQSLRSADAVGVRDGSTLGQLERAGISARLLPDPATLVAALFGPQIGARAQRGEPAEIRRALAPGYLAVQLSAEFGDDRTLAQLAAALARCHARTGLGIALFRAGAAPWHDELEPLQRLAARLPAGAVRLLQSLNIWDICALIASSRGFCGSSLHGRIVASAFALPRLSLQPPSGGAKVLAYARSWDLPSQPAGLALSDEPQALDAALAEALAAPPDTLAELAGQLAARYRSGFAQLMQALDAPPSR